MSAVRSPITTHVLDTALGKPAAGIEVVLERQEAGGEFVAVGQGVTNADGRIADLLAPGTLRAGVYRLHFALESYFGETPHFFPYATLVFKVQELDAHYHVPLLLSPFGFSSYRGS